MGLVVLEGLVEPAVRVVDRHAALPVDRAGLAIGGVGFLAAHRSAPAGCPLPLWPFCPAPLPSSRASSGDGGAPSGSSDGGRPPRSFLTNWKPKRPLMQRLLEVTGWSSGDVTLTISLSCSCSSRLQPTPQ